MYQIGNDSFPILEILWPFGSYEESQGQVESLDNNNNDDDTYKSEKL